MTDRLKDFISGSIRVIVLITAMAAVSGQLGRVWWIFEILSHFYHVYWMVFVLSLVVFILQKKKVNWLLISVGGFIITGVMVFQVYWQGANANADHSATLRIMSFNTLFYESKPGSIVDDIIDIKPDIVVLVEPDEKVFAVLDNELKDRFPYQHHITNQGSFNMALMASQKLGSFEIFRLANSAVPIAKTIFHFNDKAVSLYAVHPRPPYSKKLASERRAYYGLLAENVKQDANNIVVVGDFNTTPWSPLFRDLLSKSNLRDSRPGWGYQATWPTWLPAFLRIPLDHVLISDDIEVITRFVPRTDSSDHLPVVVDLAI